ncbi:LLM class flavin-dependent oxidoreductase [Nocardia fusca]|uniref:LLM class flavin-dependent oxidoreductase n=1 Tax=Nocardia fusca TaxID=941183 RepID=UPI0007A7387C|nr:LLM class flavin-dependent oxidoreductase [Nocardia fusca]
MKKQLHLAGFVEASHLSHSQATWKNPRTSRDFLRPEYYQHLGRVLEQGKFDLMFFGDSLSVPSRYAGSIEAALRYGISGAVDLDPRVVLPMVAAVTDKLGLVATSSTTYFHPFDVARLFATLDHLTAGRVGWNVVTSVGKSEAANFGFEQHLEHDERYRRADEFISVAYKLWTSWQPGALWYDRERSIFADPEGVAPIDHDGDYFKVEGPLTVPRSPQGRPVILQAGASPSGRAFAARWSEVIFTVNPDAAGRRQFYDDMKTRVSNFDRDPSQVQVLPAFMPIVGETEAIAIERMQHHNSLLDPEAGLVMMSFLLDYDFSKHDLDQPVGDIDVPGIQGLFQVVQQLSSTKNNTLRDVAKSFGASQLCPLLVGTGAQIADEIEQMLANGELDGMMIVPPQIPGGFEDFVALVVPELQRRGIFRTEYTGSTLRDHLGLGPAAFL